MTESTIILTYLLVILVIAIVTHISNLLRERSVSWELSRPRLGRCPNCNLVFLVKNHTQISHCPRCQARTATYLTKN